MYRCEACGEDVGEVATQYQPGHPCAWRCAECIREGLWPAPPEPRLLLDVSGIAGCCVVFGIAVWLIWAARVCLEFVVGLVK